MMSNEKKIEREEPPLVCGGDGFLIPTPVHRAKKKADPIKAGVVRNAFTTFLAGATIPGSDGYDIVSDHSHGSMEMQIRVDAPDGPPRYFSIKVTEHHGE
jgi:hypothetical protein